MMDGVYSNLIIIGAAILVISGWFSVITNKIGTPRKAGSLLIIIYFLMLYDLPLNDLISINVGGYLLPFFVYFLFWFRLPTTHRIHIFATTILLGASYFLMKEIFLLDPILLFLEEKYQIPLFMTVLAFIVESDLFRRILLLLGGNLLGELIYNFRNQDLIMQIVLGDGYFRDMLWISVILITIFNYIAHSLKVFWKQKNNMEVID